PALVEREIEETIRGEAARIGATITSIRLDRDPRTGLRAVVEAIDGADRLKEALDRYAVKSEVTAINRIAQRLMRADNGRLQMNEAPRRRAPEQGGNDAKEIRSKSLPTRVCRACDAGYPTDRGSLSPESRHDRGRAGRRRVGLPFDRLQSP